MQEEVADRIRVSADVARTVVPSQDLAVQDVHAAMTARTAHVDENHAAPFVRSAAKVAIKM